MIDRIKNKINRELDNLKQSKIIIKRNTTKVFCIGRNKTGTTSLAKEFKELGFIVGNQREAEFLAKDYIRNKFRRIIRYCKRFEAFQDAPFSWKGTFKIIDKAYPNSKFILTVRDSSDQWYDSVVNFHSKLFGKGNVPTVKDLQNANYIYKGWIWENIKYNYNITELEDPYDKTRLIEDYEKHNKEVMDYFKDRPNDLLVINLSEQGAYKKFIDYLGVKSNKNDFPWENKTSEI